MLGEGGLFGNVRSPIGLPPGRGRQGPSTIYIVNSRWTGVSATADPALQPHNPALVIRGSLVEHQADVEVELTDGSRGWAGLLAWQRDSEDRWLCLLRWYATDSRGECSQWFVYDPGRVRPM